MDANELAEMRKLLDRNAIYECTLRYTRGLDRDNDALLRSAFHADARDDHGSYIGLAQNFPARKSSAKIRWKDYMHYILNQTIDHQGDTAHVETYYFAVLTRHDGSVDMTGGRYNDRAERRNGKWAIAERITTLEWSTTGPAGQSGWVPPGLFIAATRDRNDPSYMRPLKISREFRDMTAS